MRKIISLFTIFLLLINVGFSKNFFSSRFFEFKVDVPVTVLSSSVSLNDIFVDNLVIDLTQISDNADENGFEFSFSTSPGISSSLNIGGFYIGNKMGLDGYIKVNVSNDIMKLFGRGYKAGDKFKINIKGDMDVFAYEESPVELELGNVKFGITPGVFLPVATFEKAFFNASFCNDKEGNIKAVLDQEFNILISSGVYSVDKDILDYYAPFEYIIGEKLSGFDLSGFFEFPILNNINLRVSTRVPVIPGKITQRICYVKQYSKFEAYVPDLIMPPENSNNNSSGTTAPDGNKPQNGDDTNLQEGHWESTGDALIMEHLPEPFLVNRPFKLNVYGIYKPVSFFSLEAGGGLGVKHPFDSKKPVFFPEYCIKGTFSLIDILKAVFSTEYTNQIFKHEITGIINLRLVELNVGVSMEAANFMQSFNSTGFGGRVSLTVGF